MKLKNKETGEVIELMVHKRIEDDEDGGQVYTPFEFNPVDYEAYSEPKEPKTFWYIGQDGVIFSDTDTITQDYADRLEAIGNYFETEEEAEKAVEKLKAWKRLKDNGFKFDGWKRDERYCGDFTITATDQTSCDDKDLDLLFGGEE